MIKTIDMVEVTGLDEVLEQYAVACSMLRAGLGQNLWTSMRMTYRAAANKLEDLIHMMEPERGAALIAEIRNSDY